MKKNGLFKIIMGALLLVLILTFIIPNSDGARSYLAIGDVVINTIQSFYYFFDSFIFVLFVGGFYGVLNKIPSYRKLLDKIVNKFKKKGNVFVASVIVIFAIIATLTGITLPLFVIIPFVISIILLMGYDKLVALTSTVGAILVGSMSGILSSFRVASSYGYTVSTFEELASLEKFANTLPRIILLVLSVALLIFFVLRHINNKETKNYELTNDDIMLEETKSADKKTKIWPLVTCLVVLMVFVIVGLIPWNGLFEITIFDDLHTWLTGLKIGEFYIFNSIISSSFPALGSWANIGTFLMVMVMMTIMIVVLKFAYKVKWNEVLNGFVEGAKKILPTATLVILAQAVLVCSFTNGFFQTIITNVMGWTEGFNVATGSLLTLLGSAFNVDLYYVVSGVFSPMLNLVENTAVHSTMAIMFSSLYYLVMLFAPTSMLLVMGLSYLDVPYKSWLKYIWRLLLGLFIIVFAMMIIMLI